MRNVFCGSLLSRGTTVCEYFSSRRKTQSNIEGILMTDRLLFLLQFLLSCEVSIDTDRKLILQKLPCDTMDLVQIIVETYLKITSQHYDLGTHSAPKLTRQSRCAVVLGQSRTVCSKQSGWYLDWQRCDHPKIHHYSCKKNSSPSTSRTFQRKHQQCQRE